MGVLRQKSVAGMDGLDIPQFRGADDAIDAEVAVDGGGGADAVGFVGQRQVVRPAVSLREDADCFDAHFTAGADHAQGNFTAVGDQNPLKHSWSFAGIGLKANAKSKNQSPEAKAYSQNRGQRRR